MIDKKLVTLRFSKNLKSYDSNAVVQKKMAEKLVSMLPGNKYRSVLETGCGTGILTKRAAEKISYSRYVLNDIVAECGQYVKQIIPGGVFVEGDIEETDFDSKFDLIISNACLQWCGDFEKTVLKLFGALNDNGVLAFSVFGEKNLAEVRQTANAGLDYVSANRLKTIFSKRQIVSIEEEIEKIYFQKPADVLRHLKTTGANSVTRTAWTKKNVAEFENRYKDLFRANEKIYATYHCVYAVIKNTDQKRIPATS